MWDKSIPILQHISALQDYLQREQLVVSEITEIQKSYVLIFFNVDFHVFILYLNVQTLYVSCAALLC